MPGKRRSGSLLLFAVLFLCLHAICLVVFHSQATAATYPFLLLAPSCALAACCWRARTSAPEARLPWILLSLGLLLWTIGMFLSAWEELLQNVPYTIAFFSDFVFFLYGAPILLAISSPDRSQRLPLFVWMDGIQGALTAYLTYITLFSVAPFTATPTQPISANLLAATYNVENLVLAAMATLRLVAQPRGGEERRFYRILASFLWAYAVFAAIYNYCSLLTEEHALFDLLVDAPFLLLTLAALAVFAREQAPAQPAPRRPLALFIDNAGPLFYTLALTALGVDIIQTHFYFGVAAIAIALAVYGVRTVTLQSRYIQSQQALLQTQDRLEKILLKDALTDVANRRCFDQTIGSEWNRAVRMRQPLSLLMIDIDCFKSLNDNYGHQCGDQCLIDVARAMQTVLTRSGDLLARYGGEEFSVILPATGRSGAELVAGQLLEAVRSLQIPNATALGDFITISIGIAVQELPETGAPASLIEASDRALYKAKQNGRNRLEHA